MAIITETELYRNMRTYGVTRDQMDKFLSELSEYMPDDSGLWRKTHDKLSVNWSAEATI